MASNKRWVMFLALFLSVLTLSAQEKVPNIVMKDIHGNERNLYSLLDQGKVVIVEVFATWCNLCWQNNNAGNLEKLYSTYGPDGTDQLEIFFIEIDETTNDGSVTGNDPFGDWTMGKSYPIFNPSSVSKEFIEAFASLGVPTSNLICPVSRESIADVYQDDLAEIISFLQDCNTIYNVKDLQVIVPEKRLSNICQPTDLVFEVLNTGTEDITGMHIEAVYSNGFFFQEAVNFKPLEPGQSIEYNFGEFILPLTQKKQKINISITTEDDVLNNNTNSITFRHAQKTYKEVNLRILTDQWTEKDHTKWWIENSNGDIVIPKRYLTNEMETNDKIELDRSDCYTFIIEDLFGDGLLLGEIELTTNTGSVLFDEANFKDRGQVSFEVEGFTTATENLEENENYVFNLASNIVTDELTAQVKLPFDEDVDLKIIDLQGKCLSSTEFQASNFIRETAIRTSDCQPGIYFLQLITKEGVLTRKFVKH